MNRQAVSALLAGFVASPVLIAIYAAIVSGVLDRDLDAWARHDAALDMTSSLHASVELYRRDNQRVPSAEEGLSVVAPDYLRVVPLDPWGNRFVYKTRSRDWADIVSLGSDGQPGGIALATDVSARYGSPGTATSRVLVQALLALLLLVPGTAYALSRHRRSAAHALAGIALFWAWVVAATVAPNADLSVALVGAFSAIVIALTGTVLTVRELEGGVTCALAGALGCLLATAAMMG